MATILTTQIIDEAKGAVTTYQNTAQGLFQQLEGKINTLRADGFVGDASDGYDVFFDTKVTPALTTNLEALCSSLNTLLDNISEQLFTQVDTALGQNNQNA